MKNIFLYPIVFYRKYISKIKPPCCRFTPSCSAYAYKAINEWGALVGIPLSAYRILRCNPFCRGGEDNVPHRKRKVIPKTEIFEKRQIKNQNKGNLIMPYCFRYEI